MQCCATNRHVLSNSVPARTQRWESCRLQGSRSSGSTEEDDANSFAGFYRAMLAIKKWRHKCLIWSSIPCTGGSPYQDINLRRYPGMKEKLKTHGRLFESLWEQFEIVAHACASKGGGVAIEWLSKCKYWQCPKVKHLCRFLNLEKAECHGCQFGLTSKVNGLPIVKPWTIATNAPGVYEVIHNKKCPDVGIPIATRKFIKNTAPVKLKTPKSLKSTLTYLWKRWHEHGMKVVIRASKQLHQK